MNVRHVFAVCILSALCILLLAAASGLPEIYGRLWIFERTAGGKVTSTVVGEGVLVSAACKGHEPQKATTDQYGSYRMPLPGDARCALVVTLRDLSSNPLTIDVPRQGRSSVNLEVERKGQQLTLRRR